MVTLSGTVLFIVGVVAGVVLTGILVFVLMPKMMIVEHVSKLGFDETVAEIKKASEANNWVVPKIYELDNNFKNAGYKDDMRINVISICQPHHAYKILVNDVDKSITAIMPCRIGVYEKSDGNVYVSEMNIGMMSKMFGGNIAKVMGGVALEEEKMFRHIMK